MISADTKQLVCVPLADAETEIFADRAFSALVAATAAHYQVPASCLALQSPTGTCLKACFGDLPSYLPQPCSGHIPMCRHHITRDVPDDIPVIIQDTSLCKRVQDDELVAGPPHVRFYAGTAIRAFNKPWHVIGTLCIFDSQPRVFDVDDALLLKDVASQVSALFAKMSADRAGTMAMGIGGPPLTLLDDESEPVFS